MKQNLIKITTPYIQLQQILKFSGIAETGGHAKEMIEEGIVFVNGEQCLMRGKKLYPGDIVKVDKTEFEVTT